VLLVGAILALETNGQCNECEWMGLQQEQHFRELSGTQSCCMVKPSSESALFQQLLGVFAPGGVWRMMTLPSRRWGRLRQEASTAIQYVPVIAILSKPVDCAGARLMLLVDIPWAHRVWALPFFTVLAPPSGIINHRHRHKTSQTGHGRCWLKCDDGCRTERLSWLPIVVCSTGIA